MTIQVLIDDAQASLDYIKRFEWANQPLLIYGRRIAAWEKKYPRAPARSTYRRTGTLGRRWASRFRGGRRPEVTVENTTPYAGWVQDRYLQTETHKRTGWRTYQDGAVYFMDAFLRDIARSVNRGLRRRAGMMTGV